MPKLRCLCGFVHDLSPIPDAGWITIRDVDYEPAIELEKTLAEGDKSVMPILIGLRGRMYECRECGRLMWSRPGDRCSNFRVYRPEVLE
jgi:hypothetical protein